MIPIKHKTGYYFYHTGYTTFVRQSCATIRIEKIISGVPIAATAILYWNFSEPLLTEGQTGGPAWARQPTNEFLLMDMVIVKPCSLEALDSFTAGLARLDQENVFMEVAKLMGLYRPPVLSK